MALALDMFDDLIWKALLVLYDTLDERKKGAGEWTRINLFVERRSIRYPHDGDKLDNLCDVTSEEVMMTAWLAVVS